MKKNDLFKSCSSLGYWIISIPFIAATFLPQPFKGHLYVLFFFVAGIMCSLNFKRCKRIHCQITGIGYIFTGLIALLKNFDVLKITWEKIWAIFIIISLIAFAIEFINWKRVGSIYSKKN